MGQKSVEMRLYASLQKWRPTPVGSYGLAGIATVGDLVRENGIPEKEIAIVFINGRRGGLESTLTNGDAVSLFPLIGGG
jgi:molybdopterin converting factor small subunit